MIPIHDAPLSEGWFRARLGVVTMSHANELLTNGKGVTRRNYLLDVASEILSGITVDRFQSWDMIRGLELEPFALEAYRTKKKECGLGSPISFAYKSYAKRIGASPDGIVRLAYGTHGVEVKCPSPRTHMRYLDDVIRTNHHFAQVQGNMWVFDTDTWDFVSFCPEFSNAPLLIHTYQRDQEFIDRLADAAETAVEQIDKILAEIPVSTDPEIEAICNRAAHHISAMRADLDLVEPTE